MTNRVKCQLCNREFTQITSSHTKKSHGMILTEYIKQFPDAEIVSDEIKAKIQAKNKGKPKSEETKRKISESINRGFANGRVGKSGTTGMKMSQDTRDLLSRIRKGRKHSEETKAKIGAKHQGKIQPKNAIEITKAKNKKRFEEQGYWKNKGFKHSDATKQFFSEIAKNRSEEQISYKIGLMNNKRRGSKATPEQRERYQEARLKYMEENPDKLNKKLFNTVPELEFQEELRSRNINFQTQFRLGKYLYDIRIDKIIIEIDGPYHYDYRLHGDKTMAENDRKLLLEKQIEKDSNKTKNANDNGYSLYRIKVGQHIGDWYDQLLAQGLDIEKLRNNVPE